MKDLQNDMLPLEDYDIARARHYGTMSVVNDVMETNFYYHDEDYNLDPMDAGAVY